MPRSPLRNGARYRRARREMFALFGTRCHLCGHEGATDADHVIPVSVDPGQRIDPRAMRPAHGVRGCATCGRKCNQERGARPARDREPLKTSHAW
jgi:hypothetical protein